MAEERLIDDDKDKNKKYTVRTNADGEEEFIIFESAPRKDGGEAADVQFDEEYAFGNRSSVRFGEEEDFAAKAKECMARGNYSTALECVARAARLSPRDGETAALELRIYTRDMTDFSHGALQGARSAVRRVAEYASKDTKERLKAMCVQPVGAAVRAACDRADRLRAQNESAKMERERLFKAPFVQARKRFLLSLVPLALCTACMAVFVALFALYGGAYAVAAWICGGLAAVSFALSAFAARKLYITARRMAINRDDSRSRLGRECLAAEEDIKILRSILDAVE